MEMSQELDKLFAALSKAQGEIENAKKDSLNPHFKSKYADLASIINSYKAPLSANALVLTQLIEWEVENGATLITILGHSSGQYIKSKMRMILTKQDMQGIGSATTYMRRYAAAAILGIAQEDDDGEGSIEKPKPYKKAPVESFDDTATFPPLPQKTLSAEQIVAVLELAPVDSPLYTEICRTKKIADLTQFPADNFDKLVAYLRSRQE